MIKSKNIHIAAICGSVRSESNTSKILAAVVDELNKQENVSVTVIDPNELSLLLPGKSGKSSAEPLQKIVFSADGIVLATPEYNGSYSSVIKLIIEHLGEPSALKGKPVALVGVATGGIGAVKALEHLGSVCLNEEAIVLPGSVSVASVHKILGPKGELLDKNIEKRIGTLVTALISYIR